MEKPKRRSRVLEYFEAKKTEPVEDADAEPFQGLDEAFGLDETPAEPDQS